MESKRCPAPIDNKNLLEDPFEDEVFGDLSFAKDHRKKGQRHLTGYVYVKEELVGGVCDVHWKYGGNMVAITILAADRTEDFEDVKERIFDKFRKEFKSWENEDNENLRVEFSSGNSDTLCVSFYFECD